LGNGERRLCGRNSKRGKRSGRSVEGARAKKEAASAEDGRRESEKRKTAGM